MRDARLITIRTFLLPPLRLSLSEVPKGERGGEGKQISKMKVVGRPTKLRGQAENLTHAARSNRNEHKRICNEEKELETKTQKPPCNNETTKRER